MLLVDTGRIEVLTLSRDHMDVLRRWLNDPRVLDFYEGRDRPHSERMIEEVFFGADVDGRTRCIVHYDGKPIGYLQFYPLPTDEGIAFGFAADDQIYGLDQFIGEPDLWGRGIGTDLVAAVADYLERDLGAKRLIMDPHVENPRAVRCYEKCGFRKVRLLPAHELHEGAMRDCWLMERAAGDLSGKTPEPAD